MDAKILLAGTLGIILFGGLGLTSAYAQQTTIDNFEDEDGSCDIFQFVIGSTSATDLSPAAANTIGGQRDCTIEVTASGGGAGDNAMIEVVNFLGTDFFTYDSDNFYNGLAELHYGDGGDLNQDWSSFDRIRIDYATTDIGVSTTLTLMDGDGTTESVTKDLTTPAPGFTDWFFTDFSGAMDFSDIDVVWVKLDPGLAGDFALINIGIPTMIGGTIMPADTSALLLAGAELNAIWILPAIAAIGIGAFVVSRKRK